MAHDLDKKWRSLDVQLKENADFSSLLLSDRVLKGLQKAGFKKPSPIQLEAIPIAKIGKDLIVQAKSGTGKTLIFVITALETLRRRLFRPQVLILAPTREIAAQICTVVKSVSSSAFPKLTCCSFIGGLSVSDDIDKALTCQIVVGTPGRLKHLITEKALPVNSVRLLVFDEADQLLQMSFKQEIEDIFKVLPVDKQVIATSATYPAMYKAILVKYMREPYMACLNLTDPALLGIVHYARVVKGSPMPLLLYRTKLSVLEEILSAVKFSQCLVFCNGIQKVEVLYKDIKKWGFSAAYISSAKEQEDRLKAVDRLKRFRCKVLVSSDVTARGIDAENVDFVINFDLPFNTETYMHRVGRAGRYGSIGVAISIIEEKEVFYLNKMENAAAFKTLKLPDQITKDLIEKARFEEGEFVIKSEDIESLKMCRKQQKLKIKNSTNEKDEESDDESANKDFKNSSNTNCGINESMKAKQTFFGKNVVKYTAENENVEVNIAHVVDCNGSNDGSPKLIATKPTFSGDRTVIEKANNDIDKLHDSSSEKSCLKKPLETNQNSTVKNNTVESRMKYIQSEHLSECGLGASDYVLCQEKMPEKNPENFFVSDNSGNINSPITFFTEATFQESNENFDSDKSLGKGSKAAKPGGENIDAECGHSNSETLVSETKAEVDRELLNDLKISDNIENEDESNLPVNLPASGPQTFENKYEIYVENDEGDSNNVQKVDLCNANVSEKKELDASIASSIAAHASIHVIAKMFTDQYEKEPFIPADESCESFKKGLSSAITLSTTNDTYNKSEYFYKVFKKFQEGELQIVEKETELNNASFSLQNAPVDLKKNEQEKLVQSSAATDMPDSVSAQKVVNSDNGSQSTVTKDMPDSSSEQNVITGETGKNIPKYFCNPKCESTPQCKIKSEQGQNQLQTSSNSDQKLPKLSKLMTAFQEFYDESDSDDFEGSEYSSDLDNSEELSSDSYSDSCSSEGNSSDSCSDSGSSEGSSSDSCFDSCSSDDHTSETHCHCKNHSTIKHYSSSSSNSVGSSRKGENTCYSRYDKKHCNAKRDHRYCQQNYNCFSGRRNQSHCIGCTTYNLNQQSACLRRGNATCSRSCFIPSAHKYHCHETAAFSQWHKTFYNQWQHIQSCINLQLHFSK